MKINNPNIKKLLEKYAEIANINDISALLGWDQEVNMPQKAADSRASQIAYITKLSTDKWNDPEFRKLIEETKDSDLNTEEKGILRNLREGAKFYYKVPASLIVEMSVVSSKAFVAWHQAKTENNFKLFLPHLKKIIELNQKVANYLTFKDNPYDALLDLYEQGLTTKKVKQVFDSIQPELTELIKKIAKSKESKTTIDFENKEYSQIDQERITHFVLNKMGYDFAAGRQDISSHPFTTSLGYGDVRITNRYKRNNFVESIMVAMHEGGHGLYDQGVSKDYYLTPLDGGVSLGVHESQSRFWENQIGRSEEFINFLYPVLQAYYPQQLKNVGAKDIYKHFNKVAPGLIRVEADEVTYNLHIALRFELEDALLNSKIDPKDLPEIWRVNMKKYLGVIPSSDSEGVLQDIHWSHGTFGYFPTYTLGNLYAAQFTNTMKKKLDTAALAGNGELKPILAWLRENIHCHGSLYWPDELVKKVTGESLNAKYFLKYIKEKYSKIYNI